MNQNLKNYCSLVSLIGSTFGAMAQATLYEIKDDALALITTSDYLGGDSDEMRECVLDAVKNSIAMKKGYLSNKAIISEFSSIKKMSVLFIKDDCDEVIGALCISLPYDSLMRFQNLLSGILCINSEGPGESFLYDDDSDEEPSVGDKELSLSVITEYISNFGVEPGRVSQDERIEIICDLYDMGVYNLKGAVSKTAEELKVSEQSIYRYLTKIKKMRN